MRKITLLLCLFVVTPLAAQAQGFDQRFDLFAGYSFTRFEQKGGGANTNGWEASLGYKVTPYFSVVGDVTGNYGTLLSKSMNAHNFYGGAQVSLPVHFSPFVHALFGAMRVSLPGVRQTAFSTEVGGGLDIRVNDYLSIRAIQADVVTGNPGSTSADGRVSAGLVFHF